MKDIDFLPQQYQQARRRHDSRVSRGWLAIIALCALGIWFGVGHHKLGKAEAWLGQLEQQNKTVQAGLDVIIELQNEQTQLLERYKLVQQLTPKLSFVQTLRKLAELIPPQVALTRINIISTKGKSTPKTHSALDQLAYSISANESQKEIDQLHLSIVGVAPSQMDVALLVGRLSGCQDFADVRMEYCKSAIVEKRRICTFKVDLISMTALAVPNKNEDVASLETSN